MDTGAESKIHAIESEECAVSVIRSLRASRHARCHYSIISRFPPDFGSTAPPSSSYPSTPRSPPSIPTANDTGINCPPPPAPMTSRDNAASMVPAYICSLQEFNAVVDNANKRNSELSGQLEYLNRAIASYPQTMTVPSKDSHSKSDASHDSEDSDDEYLLDSSDDDSPQRAQRGSKPDRGADREKTNGNKVTTYKGDSGLVLSDDDDFLGDSDDDELFKNFTAPTKGVNSPMKSAPTPKSRIRGIQDLIQNKEKTLGAMNMVKPGQTIRVRATGKNKKKQ